MQNKVEQIKSKITQIFLKDQTIRKNPQTTLEEIRAYEDELTKYLKCVVLEFGWLTISKFGKEVSYQAGILVSHTQDKEFAKECLKLMEESLHDIDTTNFALIYDKVMLSIGKPQRYGTKLKSYYKESGELVTEVMPLEDTHHIDRLRAEVGLAPLDEYIKNSEKLFLQINSQPK